MFLHTALQVEINFPLKSSLLLGNIYLGFLALYVGRKEYVRWFAADDGMQVPNYVWLKMTRGEVIVVAWALLAGVTIFIWQMGNIAEVPDPLLYTLAEVVAIWCGTDALKYFKNRSALRGEAESAVRDFGERALACARERGSIDNGTCQKEFGLSQDQSSRLLSALVKARKLKPEGYTHNRKYRPA
jgi:hypothetical protein